MQEAQEDKMLPLAGAPGLSYKNLLLGKSKISEHNFPPILYRVLQSPQWIMHSVFFLCGTGSGPGAKHKLRNGGYLQRVRTAYLESDTRVDHSLNTTRQTGKRGTKSIYIFLEMCRKTNTTLIFTLTLCRTRLLQDIPSVQVVRQ